MYYDLNLPVNGLTVEQRVALLLKAAQLGYDAVAWNYEITLPLKDKINIEELVPFVGSKLPDMGVHYEGGSVMRFAGDRRAHSGSSPAEYRRVTIQVSTGHHIHQMKSHMLTKLEGPVDFLAVRVGDLKLLKQCINEMDVDIIQWDMTRAPPNLQPVKTKRQMKARGIYFEIPYANSLKARNRGFWLSNAMQLKFVSKFNLVLTSGVTKPEHMKRPEDVAILASLIGCDLASATATVSSNCFCVLKRGETRLETCQGVISVEPLDDLLQPLHSWKISGDLVRESVNEGPTSPSRVAGAKKPRIGSRAT